jgi:hypothetical protein
MTDDEIDQIKLEKALLALLSGTPQEFQNWLHAADVRDVRGLGEILKNEILRRHQSKWLMMKTLN